MRVRRRRDLLAAAGLALIAAGTGAVALDARDGGGSARVTPAPKPVLAASSIGVAPGVTGAAHAAAAVSEARAASEALARNAVRMQSVGTAGRTAVLLRALPPVLVPVTHETVPQSGAAPTSTAPAPPSTAPVQPAPTFTTPAAPTPAPPSTTPVTPAPTPTPSPTSSSGGASSGGASSGGGSSSSGSGSGSVSGGG
jgi:uncharacterized membrane protein YgcG